MRWLLPVLFLAACTNDRDTANAARAIGLSDVVPAGYAPVSCGSGDTHAQHFTARNIHGERVSGVVCCGLWKSCTVRF